jgi:hypothetical protein
MVQSTAPPSAKAVWPPPWWSRCRARSQSATRATSKKRDCDRLDSKKKSRPVHDGARATFSPSASGDLLAYRETLSDPS